MKDGNPAKLEFMRTTGKTNKGGPIENAIINRVENTIRTYKMLLPGDSVLVGVSGGPDSMALLHVLIDLADTFSIQIGIAHLNHGLRQPDSDHDAAFVASLANDLGLPCFVHKTDVLSVQKKTKQSLEDVARQIRYAFFERIAASNNFSKIATGHHAEDNAEVILMDIIRGCGPGGISGIPPVRDGRIVRPLINLSKSKLLEYLTEKGLSYRCDTSNQDVRYLRNRIRHQLIPLLKSSYNPNIIETLNRLSTIVRTEEIWIDDRLEPEFKNALLPDTDEKGVTLSVAAVQAHHIAIQRRIIRKAILEIKTNLKRIRLSHIESIVRLMRKVPAYGRLDLPDRIRVNLSEDRIVFSQEKKPLRDTPYQNNLKKTVFSYELREPGRLMLPNSMGSLVFSVVPLKQIPKRFPAGQQIVFIDMNRLSFPITIRSIKDGDRFTPLGMKGSQKVKTFFIKQKIPRSARAICPVMVNQDGCIVWVVGYRLNDDFKITSRTQNVLKGELFLA